VATSRTICRLGVGDRSTGHWWFGSAECRCYEFLSIASTCHPSHCHEPQFGQHGHEKKVSQTVSVANAGNISASISQRTLSSSEFSRSAGSANLNLWLISAGGDRFGISGITTPNTIAPDGTAKLNLSFSPATAGSDSGGIASTSNDPETSSTTPAFLGSGTSTAIDPAITTPPTNQTVAAGQTATFTVVAAGTAPLGYQWQKNAVNIAGATSAGYTTPVTATSDSGSIFKMVVSNTAGTVTSAAATVNPVPVSGIQVSSATINFGNDVVGSNSTQLLIITNTGTATLTIAQVNETGAAFSVSGSSLPLNVSAGKQTTLTVAFLSPSVGAVSGNISILSNAPSSPTTVGLAGMGIAAMRAGHPPRSLCREPASPRCSIR
jgi:hypothetical protein